MAAGAREFSVVTGGLVALAAAGTAKTILALIAPTGGVFKLDRAAVSFDGVDSAQKPILVEICRSTQATAGTSTAVTPGLRSGSGTILATAAKDYSAEPTNLTVVDEFSLDPFKGSYMDPLPLGREIESPVAGAVMIRMTIPTGGAAVNARAVVVGEE